MDIKLIIDNLSRKGYKVSFFETSQQAVDYLNSSIRYKSVGFGDSKSLAILELHEKLASHNDVYNPQSCADNAQFIECAKKCLTAQVFITSVNAMSEEGYLVNIDGTGNRIAGSLFGHEKVYFVIGINKLVPFLEDAIWRARNIAAPQNAKRLGLNTPCAKKGDKCYDCSSPDRICNALVIYYAKMDDIEMEIILINEKLGF